MTENVLAKSNLLDVDSHGYHHRPGVILHTMLDKVVSSESYTFPHAYHRNGCFCVEIIRVWKASHTPRIKSYFIISLTGDDSLISWESRVLHTATPLNCWNTFIELWLWTKVCRGWTPRFSWSSHRSIECEQDVERWIVVGRNSKILYTLDMKK